MVRARSDALRDTRRGKTPLSARLLLNQWLLSLFGAEHFEGLAQHLRGNSLEGLDENGVHRFHHALVEKLPPLEALPRALLLEYDQNIALHTRRLDERRITRGEEPVVWKYFQYLALLFTEIYLDRYFRDPRSLPWPDRNKLAYLSATGSGKTLLMHANILQYQHYLTKHGRRRELSRILLLTPNEGLSEQHLRELDMAGIAARLFAPESAGALAGHVVEIIDIHKLRDDKGTKTVAVEAFEGNNLVLVDEGHRGATGGEEGTWLRHRHALCRSGFSFEYSATFSQAVKGNEALFEQYSQTVVIDYSYRYFHQDGFGKDYRILNLDHATEQSQLEAYLVASLLGFYQQQRLYRDEAAAMRPFRIEAPLWVFVGSRVAAPSSRTLHVQDASDIVQILLFLARYLADRTGSVARIAQVLSQGVVGKDGRNVFAGRFPYLESLGLDAAQIWTETVKTVFNSPRGAAGSFVVENARGLTGEIALRVADGEPFGVIDVGDDRRLCDLCSKHPELTVVEREIEASLFHNLDSPTSTLNVLIGAKKFAEGWNSWRVSTMGLMNVGATEGSQIIQMFGRGVRLKGYGMSLKRSSALAAERMLPAGVTPPRHIALLETLSVFGIHADYMAEFRELLAREGLPLQDGQAVDALAPSVVPPPDVASFRRSGPAPVLSLPDAELVASPVVVDWYPRFQGMPPRDQPEPAPHEAHLSPKHVAFLDVDRLFFEVERFKRERGWSNLTVTRDAIAALLGDHSWYRLMVPPDALRLDDFAKVRVWEEIALALLKTYAASFYGSKQRAWERAISPPA